MLESALCRQKILTERRGATADSCGGIGGDPRQIARALAAARLSGLMAAVHERREIAARKTAEQVGSVGHVFAVRIIFLEHYPYVIIKGKYIR